MNIKRLMKFGSAIMLLAMLALLTATPLSNQLASAEPTPNDNLGFLDKGQTVDGPGFFTGRLVQVDGNVEGTTLAFGQEVRINGTINGDLFVAAQTVSVNGVIKGNIYAAGQNLRMGTQSTGDIFAAGQTIAIAKEAISGRDLFASGQWLSLDGTVQRDFHGAGSDIVITGTTGRNAELAAEKISLLDGSLIEGNLAYKSPRQAELAPEAKISGLTDWQKVETSPEPQKSTPMNTLGGILLSIASALLVWFVVKIWRPELWEDITRSIIDQPLKTIGTGVLVFLLTPMLLILLMITIIGLPLSLILGFIFGVMFYLAKIIVAVALGTLLTKRFGWTEIHKGVWPVLLSLVVLVVLMKVPVLGFLVWLLVVFTGLGALFLSNYKTASN